VVRYRANGWEVGKEVWCGAVAVERWCGTGANGWELVVVSNDEDGALRAKCMEEGTCRK
jgi:hypothetical protein